MKPPSSFSCTICCIGFVTGSYAAGIHRALTLGPSPWANTLFSLRTQILNEGFSQLSVVLAAVAQNSSPNSAFPFDSWEHFSFFQLFVLVFLATVLVQSHSSSQPCVQLQQVPVFCKKRSSDEPTVLKLPSTKWQTVLAKGC